MTAWYPTSDANQFLVRVWRRLLAFGLRGAEIAGIWGVSRPLIYQACPGRSSRYRNEARLMRARVWSRLFAQPFAMTQRELAKIWGVSSAKVCQEIAHLRYEVLNGV